MLRSRRAVSLALLLVLLLLTFASGWLTAKLRVGSRVDQASLADRERQFAERLKGVALVGRFTDAGREDRQGSPERYEISSVEKVGENERRFNAHVKFGTVDVPLVIVLPVEWAGDTPMITMTDVTIPSMGTFTVRLLFYGDRYGGTWQHGDVGGHMFGRIEKSPGT